MTGLLMPAGVSAVDWRAHCLDAVGMKESTKLNLSLAAAVGVIFALCAVVWSHGYYMGSNFARREFGKTPTQVTRSFEGVDSVTWHWPNGDVLTWHPATTTNIIIGSVKVDNVKVYSH